MRMAAPTVDFEGLARSSFDPFAVDIGDILPEK